MIGTAVPPIPRLPETAERPPCVIVTPTLGVPAILFRLAFTEVLALPADPVAACLRLDRVRALGLGYVFVFDDTGMFFDGFVAMARPDRGADPFALVLGLCPWPAATAAVGIARAATSPAMIKSFFMSVSLPGSERVVVQASAGGMRVPT
jgi:hypothetical protein